MGAGIAGLGAAWALGRQHDVWLYETAPRLGGHANTVEVEIAGRRIPVDTGFIVYNETTYPNLTRLFAALGVPTEASNMSFAVSIDGGRLEYEGSAAGLAAQPGNFLRPSYWSMLRDLLRFYREAPHFLERRSRADVTLGDYLASNGYGEPFVRDHLLPMGAAIWSCSMERMRAFPAVSFVRFFVNHGLLRLRDRPQWRTVSGGSREYVRRIRDDFPGRICSGAPVLAVRRGETGIAVRTAAGAQERFDQLVLATHADQALAILGDGATSEEQGVLGAFRYSRSRAVLHSDPRLMPRRRRAWASWNYLTAPGGDGQQDTSVTYWMNCLQNIDPSYPLFVSLNPLREPEAALLHGEFSYDHPQFDAAALSAQAALPALQGRRNTWFCGSYCGYGFHEDGLQSGLSVAEALGAPAPWAQAITPVSPAAWQMTPAGAARAAREATSLEVAAE